MIVNKYDLTGNRDRKFIVNHVMSSEAASEIFEAIYSYFLKYSPLHIKNILSVNELNKADIYIYHRPNLAKNIQKKSIIIVHHDLNELDGKLKFENFYSKYIQAKYIVCLNSLQYMFLKKRGFKNLVLIPHGYNDSFIKSRKKTLKKEKLNFLIYSRRYERRVKGESYLLDLLPGLNKNKIKFLLVGQNRSYNFDFFKNLGYDFEIYDYMPYQMSGEIYQISDFLFMCSYFEGGPANIVEAIASKTPVLCNPIGIARDLIKNNINGIYLSMNPISDIDTINRLVEKNDTINHIFKTTFTYNAKLKIYTWRQIIHKYLKLFNLLL